MKQGRPVIVLVMLAMAAALAVYFGVYAFQIFNTPKNCEKINVSI